MTFWYADGVFTAEHLGAILWSGGPDSCVKKIEGAVLWFHIKAFKWEHICGQPEKSREGGSAQSRHAGPRLEADASAGGTAFVPGGAAGLESCLLTCSHSGIPHIDRYMN